MVMQNLLEGKAHLCPLNFRYYSQILAIHIGRKYEFHFAHILLSIMEPSGAFGPGSSMQHSITMSGSSGQWVRHSDMPCFFDVSGIPEKEGRDLFHKTLKTDFPDDLYVSIEGVFQKRSEGVVSGTPENERSDDEHEQEWCQDIHAELPVENACLPAAESQQIDGDVMTGVGTGSPVQVEFMPVPCLAPDGSLCVTISQNGVGLQALEGAPLMMTGSMAPPFPLNTGQQAPMMNVIQWFAVSPGMQHTSFTPGMVIPPSTPVQPPYGPQVLPMSVCMAEMSLPTMEFMRNNPPPVLNANAAAFVPLFPPHGFVPQMFHPNGMPGLGQENGQEVVEEHAEPLDSAQGLPDGLCGQAEPVPVNSGYEAAPSLGAPEGNDTVVHIITEQDGQAVDVEEDGSPTQSFVFQPPEVETSVEYTVYTGGIQEPVMEDASAFAESSRATESVGGASEDLCSTTALIYLPAECPVNVPAECPVTVPAECPVTEESIEARKGDVVQAEAACNVDPPVLVLSAPSVSVTAAASNVKAAASNVTAAAGNATATASSVTAVANSVTAVTQDVTAGASNVTASASFPALGSGLMNGGSPLLSSKLSKEHPFHASKSTEPGLTTPSKPISFADCVRGASSGGARTSPAWNTQGGQSEKLGKTYLSYSNGISGGMESNHRHDGITVPKTLSDDHLMPALIEFFRKFKPDGSRCSIVHRGLENRSAHCFASVVLQVLVNSPEIYNFFRELDVNMTRAMEAEDFNRGETSTPLADHLISIFKEFSTGKITKKGSSKKQHADVPKGPPLKLPEATFDRLFDLIDWNNYEKGRHEDAQQFLFKVLETLHEETKLDGEEQNCPNGIEEVANLKAVDGNLDREADGWLEVGPKKKATHIRKTSTMCNSVISYICRVITRRETFCDGKIEHAELEPYWGIQTHIQPESVTSLKTALQQLTTEEVHEYVDPVTNQKKEKKRRTLIDELPPVLFIHILSADYNPKTGDALKVIKKFTFEVDLEITKDMMSSKGKAKTSSADRFYKLFAVVFHIGSAVDGGHYHVCTYDSSIDSWILKDDSRVEIIQHHQLFRYFEAGKRQMPYFLVYHRADNKFNGPVGGQ